MVRSLFIRIIPLLICSLAINYGGQVHLWGWSNSDSTQIERNPVKENIADSTSNTSAVQTRRNVTISGQLVRNDLPSDGLEGAQVSLAGTENYVTFSGVNGFFTFVEVIPHQNYTLTVSAAGFVSYDQQLTVNDDDLDLGIIVIYEYPYPPNSLLAYPGENDNYVSLTWNSPVEVDYYYFDFENNDGEWLPTANWDPVGDWEWTDAYDVNDWYFSGSNNAVPPPLAHSGSGLWGTKINTNHSNSGGFSYLEKTFDLSGYTGTVLCFWSWNNSYGQFDYGQVRVNGDIVWGPSWDHQDTQWTLVEIDLSLYNGLPEVTIIFEHFATTTINYAGWYIDDVYLGPEVSFPPVSINYRESSKIDRIINNSQIKKSKGLDSVRVFDNYRVYRFLSDDINNQYVWDEIALVTDTTHIDHAWENLPYGFYNYAVKAEYTDGVLSVPAISNWLGNNMTTILTVNITTDSGDSAAGSLVSLYYQNQDPDGYSHIYTQEAEGDVPATTTFTDILKGTYDIEVTKPGYSHYTEENIAIHNPTTMNILLNEIPNPPVNLTFIARNNYVYLSWQAPYPYNARAFIGYNIYRDEERLNNGLIADPLFYDTEVENETSYTYYVTAVYTLVESQPSNIVSVVPGTDQFKIIGEDTTSANTLPLNMYYRCSLSQTIYMTEEINMTGNITQIMFYNSFSQDILDKPVQIWIGETNLTNLSAGWISSTELEPVFNGYVDFPSGQNQIAITLDNSYYYTGIRNLVIMSKRVMDETSYSPINHFFYSIIPAYPQRSRNIQSQTIDFDPVEPSGGSLTSRVPNTGLYFTTEELGSIGGYVLDENDQPLNRARLQIIETEQITYTNTEGYYLFPFVIAGTYTLIASFLGYHDGIAEDVFVTEYEFTPSNFFLDPYIEVNVSGRIVGSDQPDTGLDNTFVSLDGQGNFTTYTDSSGNFLFSGVYANNVYVMTIERTGYTTLILEITVGSSDLELGDIVIDEFAYPPLEVTATLNLENNVEVYIDWLAPETDGEIALWLGRRRMTSSTLQSEFYNYSDVSRINYSTQYQNPGRTLVGYIIYRLRSEQEQEPEYWDEIGTVSGEQTNFTDSGLSELLNGDYRYAVRSLYTNNILSQPSFSNSITYLEEIPAITNLQAVIDGNDVYLTWEFVDDSQINNSLVHYQNIRNRESPPVGSDRVFWGFKITRNDQLIVTGLYETNYIDLGQEAGDYLYSVIGDYTNGSTNMIFVEVTISQSTDGDTEPEHLSTILGDNFPNPFNEGTTIFYSLNKGGRVIIELYNIRGQHLKTLLDEYQVPGKYYLFWNGKDDYDRVTGSGIFFVMMKTGSYQSIKKLIHLN